MDELMLVVYFTGAVVLFTTMAYLRGRRARNEDLSNGAY
jgi:hypothetical protein